MFSTTSREEFSLKIDSLVRGGFYRHTGEVYPVITSVEQDYEVLKSGQRNRSRHPSKPDSRPRFDSSSSSDGEVDDCCVTYGVYGADIGDIPTQYSVEGLKANEFPVIGTYVDKRILPGFRYRVRKLGSDSNFLFKGKALTLVSVGMGYGKRITFESESLNHNSNYFYSDTHPAGYAFSVVAAEANDSFTVTNDDMHTVAEVSILDVQAQKEIGTEVKENGTVVKKIAVTFTGLVNYSSDGHGLMPLYSRERLHQTGIAYVEKERRSKKAFTNYIEDLELQHYGTVTFRA